jgi:Bacterial PH domain
MQSIPDDLRNLLGPAEQMQLYIRQKIYHPKIDIDSVVITNERIILRHPHPVAALMNDYTDFSYHDVSNVILDKGILRSEVKCTLRFGGEPLALSGLPNSDAEEAYGLIRENMVKHQAPLDVPQAAAPSHSQPATPTPPGPGHCKKCGFSLIPDDTHCGNCGAPV